MLQRIASGLVFSAIVGVSATAQAFGGWMAADPGFRPTEQRVALAVTPQRTTLWTSLRFQTQGGAVGVVIPVAAGAVVDLSSDAWFESLEVATAPRVFPTPDESPYCFGVDPATPTPFDTAGHVEHTPSVPLVESALLADAASVQAWAAARGMTLSTALQAGLGNFTGSTFLAMRFQAPAGPGITPTVRVAIPGSAATLPLSLTQATGEDLLVTTWLLGAGTAQLDGSVPVEIATEALVWDAGGQTSNYAAARLDTLTSGAEAVVEAASHDGIAADTTILDGNTIDGLLRTYFTRASAYDGLPVDPAACLTAAAPAFSSTSPVAPSCPLGLVVPPPAPCIEMPAAGTIDPQTLRCGGDADDVAVALSGAAPGSIWLARWSLAIQPWDHGLDWHAIFGGISPLLPVRVTGEVDLSNCSTFSPPSSSGGSSGAVGGSYTPPSGPSGGGAGNLSGTGNAPASSGSGCDGSTVDASGSGGSDAQGSDSVSDSSGSDSSESDSSESDDSDDADCSMHHRPAPRPYPLIAAALALLAPMRRRGTARRAARRGPRAGSAPDAKGSG